LNASEYNHLLSRFSSPLLRFSTNFLRNEEEAKDIVQDVFEKLWINREKVEMEKVKSWLFTCAHNAMINRLNKRNRTCSLDLDNHEKGRVDQFRFESNEIIDQIVSGLPPIQKSIILLRDLEGYRYDEIGEILSLNPSQVKVYLFRARLKIKKQLVHLKKVI
jgi:RNA polymerase sigma factor (sigma-70 family)